MHRASVGATTDSGTRILAHDMCDGDDVEAMRLRIGAPRLADLCESRRVRLVDDDRDHERVESSLRIARRQHHALIGREWRQCEIADPRAGGRCAPGLPDAVQPDSNAGAVSLFPPVQGG